MLYKISLLTSLIFAVCYPLCFLVSFKDPLKNKFHHFHIGLPCVVGGLVLIFLVQFDIEENVKVPLYIWYTAFTALIFFYWNKDFPSPAAVGACSLGGIYAFAVFYGAWLGAGWMEVSLWILGGLIFCASLYAMNLGHWYLNVHGLPVKHLRGATYVFWYLIGLRFIADFYLIATHKFVYNGESLAVWRFFATLDGFLLSIAVGFGTLFPLIAIYFVNETLKIKNTQSATGILYVILCAVLFGDIAYKYYLFKFGIAL